MKAILYKDLNIIHIFKHRMYWIFSMLISNQGIINIINSILCQNDLVVHKEPINILKMTLKMNQSY